MGNKILIVGDHSHAIHDLKDALDREGFDVATANDGIKALHVAQSEHPDLVVLSPTYAWLGGEQVRHTPRRESSGTEEPIIVLNPRTEEVLRVLPRLAGSDCVTGASFNMEELVIRVKRLQQRTNLSSDVGKLVVGIVEMDLNSWTVSVAGKPVSLSSKEFGLLRMLLGAKSRLLTRDALLAVVWEHGEVDLAHSRTVDVHIGRLRRKLGAARRYIVTVRGAGYRFEVVP